LKEIRILSYEDYDGKITVIEEATELDIAAAWKAVPPVGGLYDAEHFLRWARVDTVESYTYKEK
jgi:hypothetical protein